MVTNTFLLRRRRGCTGRGSEGPELDGGKHRSSSGEVIFQVGPEGTAGRSQVEHERSRGKSLASRDGCLPAVGKEERPDWGHRGRLWPDHLAFRFGDCPRGHVS